MTTLVNKIKMDSVAAMKDKTEEGKARLSTLRLLVAELEKEKVQHKLSEITGLTEEQTITVINRQIKKLDKEIEAYVAVNRGIEKQEQEQAVLREFLPKQMTEEEIRQTVELTIESVRLRGGNFGQLMGTLKELKGKADMGLVSKIAKEMWG